MASITQDPTYTKVSASLRGGKLYVKAPFEKVVVLLGALIRAEEDLIQKEIHWESTSSHKSFVFVGSLQDWQEDAITLSGLIASETIKITEEFRQTIELGVLNDPTVDWIGRVEGPGREPANIDDWN
jgi:hypothetical protein